jgi:hypothetical protein
MGARFPKNTLFAYLRNDGMPVFCTRKAAYEWLRSRDDRERASTKHDEINGWLIDTTFQFYSSDPDVPMFWEVSFFKLKTCRWDTRRFGTKDAALDQDDGDWWKKA